MHTDRTDTTERPGCAAAAAGVHCSPRCYSSRGRDCENPLPRPAAAPQTTPESGYMSCPRECGVDVREHASSGLIDGRCDTDSWQSLAVDLRRAADRIASLAGTPAPDVHTSLSLYVGCYAEQGPEECRPVVEAIAAALNGTATDGRMGAIWERQANAVVGGLRVTASTRIPAPEDAELVALRARVAELEAERAGGAR